MGTQTDYANGTFIVTEAFQRNLRDGVAKGAGKHFWRWHQREISELLGILRKVRIHDDAVADDISQNLQILGEETVAEHGRSMFYLNISHSHDGNEQTAFRRDLEKCLISKDWNKFYYCYESTFDKILLNARIQRIAEILVKRNGRYYRSLEDARMGVHDVAYKKDFDLRKCFSMCFRGEKPKKVEQTVREDGRLAEHKSSPTRARWNGRSSEGGPLKELASLRVTARMRAIFEHPSLEKAESVTSGGGSNALKLEQSRGQLVVQSRSESDKVTERAREAPIDEDFAELTVEASSDSEDVGIASESGSEEEEEEYLEQYCEELTVDFQSESDNDTESVCETLIVESSLEGVNDSSDSEDVRITAQIQTESVTSGGGLEEEEEEKTPIVATSSDDVEDHCELEDVAIPKTEFQRNLDTQNEEYEKRLSIARAHRMWWEEETARLEPNGRKTRRDKVQKVLADNVTVIFVIGERSCRLQNSDGKVVRVDGNVDVRLGVKELTGQQTFPQLFINGKLSQA